jgi:hypothetical protein
MSTVNGLYPPTSPYFLTDIANTKYLDIMSNRAIPALGSDVYWTITPVYQYRPDTLAYDLYNDPRLWWVFAQRNPNRLKDPLFDFVTGLQIYLPKMDTLKLSLGL